MKKFLLHTCCAPCGAHIFEELKDRSFEVTAFYYNPNIFPEKEYEIRKNEVEKYCKENKINFIEKKDSHEDWKEKVKGLEMEPEGGKRCEICYRIRLKKTVECAQENGFEYFDSTLAISPHKNYEKIKEIGDDLADEYGLLFLGENWKKKGGYQKSCEISHKNDFYRQNYCGCEYSIRK